MPHFLVGTESSFCFILRWNCCSKMSKMLSACSKNCVHDNPRHVKNVSICFILNSSFEELIYLIVRHSHPHLLLWSIFFYHVCCAHNNQLSIIYNDVLNKINIIFNSKKLCLVGKVFKIVHIVVVLLFKELKYVETLEKTSPPSNNIITL